MPATLGELLASLTATAQGGLGLGGILEAIASFFHAEACIVWSRMPTELEDPEPSRQQVFVVASWIRKEEEWALAPISADRSVAGRILRTGKPRIVNNIEKTRGLDRTTPFLRRASINSLCGARATLTDGRQCALCIYSTRKQAFSQADLHRLSDLSRHLSFFHRSIADQASLSLLQEIAKHLTEGEHHFSGDRVKRLAKQPESLPIDVTSDGEFREILARIATLTSERFRCVETSIFLEDANSFPRRYRLCATTWPDRVEKEAYSADTNDGLTGWVLKNGRPVLIADLIALRGRPDALEGTFPGLRWHDALDITSQVRRFWNWPNGAALPVLSWMAWPILTGERIVGVIRCCAARKSPYYFGEHEIDLLALVSGQISRLWSGVSRQVALAVESKNWEALVSSVELLNRRVPAALAANPIDVNELFATALKLAQEAIAGAHSTDVRLYDKVTKELYFAAVHGRPWEDGSGDKGSRKNKRYPVDPSGNNSIGARVFVTQDVYSNNRVRGDRLYSETFPETAGLIVAPISLKDHRYGVIDIRFRDMDAIPLHAAALAQLLGEQLGLYQYLATTLGSLHSTQTELSQTSRAQRQAFEDLKHQLNGPINSLYIRAESLATAATTSESARRLAVVVKGLAGKARRVSQNLGLYVQLANNQPIKTRLVVVQRSWLLQAVIEAASDNEVCIDPERAISIHVDRPSFGTAGWMELTLDRGLLEQSLTNLLDNAGKYSFKNTVVHVSAGLTSDGRFYISVINRGLRLTQADAGQARERQWRGSVARQAAVDGSGIGLWLVDQMMQAQKGELVIYPTNAKDETEFRLVFRAQLRRGPNAAANRRR